MQELDIAFVAIGGPTLMSSLVTGFTRSTVYFLTEPMATVILGLVIGSLGFHLLDLANWGDPFTILEQFARLTVGLADDRRAEAPLAVLSKSTPVDGFGTDPGNVRDVGRQRRTRVRLPGRAALDRAARRRYRHTYRPSPRGDDRPPLSVNDQ